MATAFQWLKDGIPGKSGAVSLPAFSLRDAIRGGKFTLEDVEFLCKELQRQGLLVNFTLAGTRAAVPFVDFLLNFWDFDSSQYVKEKRAHGQTIGRHHCDGHQGYIERFYKPYFNDRPLNSISREDIKSFSLSLTQVRTRPEGLKGHFAEKLSTEYTNKILIAGTTALGWAFREGLIPTNPAAGIMRFSVTPKKRGVLTPAEAKILFSAEWPNRQAFTASLLAATTGLRLGEILAIRKNDVGGKILNIQHSWSSYESRLKNTKTGEERRVPLLPQVKEKLLALVQENPHGDENENPYIFYGILPDRPIDGKVLLNGLHAACKAAGIDSLGRNVCFHSWRHYFASRMVDTMAPDAVKRITGHASKSVFEEYASHVTAENLEEMAEATEKTFSNILSFRKGA
jgi:integrase